MTAELPPTRHLSLEGADNVRDVGGYRTQDGRHTRWKTLLRADSLRSLTPAAQAALVAYGVRTVVDLRGTNEVHQSPDPFAISSEVAYHHQNMMGDQLIKERAEAPAVAPDSKDKRYLDLYIAILERRRAIIREILLTLAAPGALPALFHCSAGKDRAGLVAALTLGLAGVPAHTIAEDYGLTAHYLVGRYLEGQESLGVSTGDYTWQHYQQEFCSPHVMQKVLQYLDGLYGGVEGYVKSIGLRRHEIEILRDALLE